MKTVIFSGVIVLLLAGAAVGQTAPPPQPLTFIELWNSAAFYDTNLEKQRFASILSRYEGKFGLNVFHFPLQVYGVYYGVFSQDSAYWNNSLFSGAGIRLKPFQAYRGKVWFTEWISGLKIFAENLSASYQKNAASAEALADEDFRYGIDVWYEWNQDNPDRRKPWGELWLNYSRRSTNFGWDPAEYQTGVLKFEPKFGVHLARDIKAYLRADVTYSDKSGSDYSFLNIADYGVGVRFEPLREYGEATDFFKKFKMFAEVLGVSYLKERPADASKVVTSDVRFGVEFSYGR